MSLNASPIRTDTAPLRRSPLRKAAHPDSPPSVLRKLDVMYVKFAEKHKITHDDVAGIIESYRGIFVGTLPEINICYMLQKQKTVPMSTLKGLYAYEQAEDIIDTNAKYAIAYDPTSQHIFRLYKYDGNDFTYSSHSIESLTEFLKN